MTLITDEEYARFKMYEDPYIKKLIMEKMEDERKQHEIDLSKIRLKIHALETGDYSFLSADVIRELKEEREEVEKEVIQKIELPSVIYDTPQCHDATNLN